MRVCVFEPEEKRLESIGNLLNRTVLRAEVYLFGNAQEMLDFCLAGFCDLAVIALREDGLVGFEIADQLQEHFPKVNLLFLSETAEHAYKALQMHPTGYLTYPVTEKILKKELLFLRYPPAEQGEKRMSVRCFGNFEIYVDGKPMKFHRSKSRELIAYLVDRKGRSVTSGELRAVLWEDATDERATNAYLQKLKKDILTEFREGGVVSVLDFQKNRYAIRPSQIDCDYYDYLDYLPQGIAAYHGEYMNQYSWGEERNEVIKDNLSSYRRR